MAGLSDPAVLDSFVSVSVLVSAVGLFVSSESFSSALFAVELLSLGAVYSLLAEFVSLSVSLLSSDVFVTSSLLSLVESSVLSMLFDSLVA